MWEPRCATLDQMEHKRCDSETDDCSEFIGDGIAVGFIIFSLRTLNAVRDGFLFEVPDALR